MASDTVAAKRSWKVFPAGSNGEFNLPEDLSTVIVRGKDAEVWDINGNRYIDFSMGWGTCLVGHARDEVVKAVQEQAANGSNFAYINDQSLALAEELIILCPALEQLRFCASGTEATMYCERIARAFTGRQKILKFEGAYHGANATGVTSLFPRRLLPYPTPDPSSAGIEHVSESVLVAPFNDFTTTQRIIREHANELAAVIVEPLHRCTSPKEGFLAELAEETRRAGSLLIFDEVVTGFRLALGGAQEYYGVVPDLVAYGKALGGGYPIGLFGGKKEIMGLVSEDLLGKNEKYVWTASSLGGNPVTCAAARAALEIYRQPGTYEYLRQIGEYLREGMRKCLKRNCLSGQVIGDGPLAQILHTDEMVHDYREQKRLEDGQRRRRMMLGLFKRRVFLNPIGTKFYLSLRHTKEICDEFLLKLDEVLAEIIQEMD